MGYKCNDHALNDCNVTSRCVGGLHGKDQCRKNHTGPLCGACKTNYRLWDDGYCYGCRKSPDNLFHYILYSFVIILLGVLAIQAEVSAFYFFAFTSTRRVRRKTITIQDKQRDGNDIIIQHIEGRDQICWEHFVDAKARGEWVRIMMNYLQIASYIDIVFEIQWPNNFAWVPRYMRMFSSFDVTSWIHTFNWCLKFLGSVRYHSFIVICMMVFVIILIWILKHCCRSLKPDQKIRRKGKKTGKGKVAPNNNGSDEDSGTKDESWVEMNKKYIKSHFKNIRIKYANFVKASFYMFSLMHCGVVARSFQMYRCEVELEPWERYLNADYAIPCHDPFTQWGASAALATFMLIIIGLGIPLYVAFRLRAYDMYIRSIMVTRDDIQNEIDERSSMKEANNEVDERDNLREIEFDCRLKIAENRGGKNYYIISNVYGLYKENMYWWELIEIFRSAIMTGCLILLRPGSFLQHVLGTLLLLVHLALVTVIKPYRNVYDNNVQFILSAVLVVTLPATAAVHRAKDTEERDGMLNYIIFLNVAVFIFAFILRARQDMQLKEKEQLKKKVHPSPRKRPPQPPPSPPPFGNKRPLPPIKNSDPTADFDFDDRDSEEESKSDHEDEQNDGDDGYERGDRVEAKVDDSTEFYAGEVVRVNRDGTINIKFDNGKRKSGVKSSQIRSATKKDEQKIDVRPTPPKKLVLQPIRPDGQRLKPGAPSFRGLQRLNTEHRFKITRQMSALQKLDLDGDGELEPDEIIKAYMEDGLSRDEAQQKIDELRGKSDIDGDGVVSLKEALNTELANAMEEEVEEDREKFKKEEEQHQDEHKNHTKERLRKRIKEQRKKQRGKKKQEENS